MFTFLHICLRHHHRQLAVIASLAFASTVCVVLLALRIIHTRGFIHVYLLWNLFLAWLPMICSLAAYNIYKRRSRLSWLVVVSCALVWLLFFPNAPYLLTDLIHLRPQENIPFWFDLILIVAFAWTGFFLGLISLFLMQALVRKAMGAIAGWTFAVGVLGVSGFGIYLGRFLRWNSWDVIVNPHLVLIDIVQQLRHPVANWHTLAFSVLFSIFLIATYLILMSVTHLSVETDYTHS
ncbi:MAG: DUF1361 domain-containing protein [Anaerolineae bacterium]|nr:DUF1361 domain-containing protein [Anaerolineae bacterium]